MAFKKPGHSAGVLKIEVFMFTRNRRIAGLPAAGLLAITSLFAGAAYAQSGVQTQAIVTVLPKSNDPSFTVPQTQVQATVNGKKAQISNWIPLRGEHAGLQLMLLIDDSARSGLTLQYNEMRAFVQNLPEGTQVGVAYMQNGRSVVTQNFTTDRKAVNDAFVMTAGVPGGTGSPYFCLSDLAKRWPSTPSGERREVLMITDGVDLYYGRRYDPNDPYVQSAIADSQRAGLTVFSIFFRNTGRFDNSEWTESGAQSYLQQVSQGTGGRSFWQGFGNPVSFAPFLDELSTRLKNQYELGILASPKSKAQLQTLKVKVSTPGVKVDAPQMIMVPGSESASR
jgi:hypothetical protein